MGRSPDKVGASYYGSMRNANKTRRSLAKSTDVAPSEQTKTRIEEALAFWSGSSQSSREVTHFQEITKSAEHAATISSASRNSRDASMKDVTASKERSWPERQNKGAVTQKREGSRVESSTAPVSRETSPKTQLTSLFEPPSQQPPQQLHQSTPKKTSVIRTSTTTTTSFTKRVVSNSEGELPPLSRVQSEEVSLSNPPLSAAGTSSPRALTSRPSPRKKNAAGPATPIRARSSSIPHYQDQLADEFCAKGKQVEIYCLLGKGKPPLVNRHCII